MEKDFKKFILDIESLIDFKRYKLAAGRLEKMRKTLEKKEEKIQVLGALCATYLHIEEYEKCLEVVEEILKLDPDSTGGRYTLGILHLQVDENYLEAFKIAEALLKNDKTDADYLWLKAEALYHLNKIEEAHKIIVDQINEIDDDHDRAKNLHARIHKLDGTLDSTDLQGMAHAIVDALFGDDAKDEGEEFEAGELDELKKKLAASKDPRAAEILSAINNGEGKLRKMK